MALLKNQINKNKSQGGGGIWKFGLKKYLKTKSNDDFWKENITDSQCEQPGAPFSARIKRGKEGEEEREEGKKILKSKLKAKTQNWNKPSLQERMMPFKDAYFFFFFFF